jgi:hypothetical protein
MSRLEEVRLEIGGAVSSYALPQACRSHKACAPGPATDVLQESLRTEGLAKENKYSLDGSTTLSTNLGLLKILSKCSNPIIDTNNMTQPKM